MDMDVNMFLPSKLAAIRMGTPPSSFSIRPSHSSSGMLGSLPASIIIVCEVWIVVTPSLVVPARSATTILPTGVSSPSIKLSMLSVYFPEFSVMDTVAS